MRKLLSEKVEAFYKSHASPKRTLDIGSRKGRHSAYFPDIVTIDISPDNDPDIVADAHALPFPDATFDVVLCIEVLEHVRDPKKVIAEIYRVLKPQGILLLTTRFLFPVHEAPEDRYRFTHYALSELCSDFTSVTVMPETKPMTALGCLLQRLVWQSDFVFPNKIIKGVLLSIAWCCMKLDWLTVTHYGDVSKKSVVEILFTTGFHLKAIK